MKPIIIGDYVMVKGDDRRIFKVENVNDGLVIIWGVGYSPESLELVEVKKTIVPCSYPEALKCVRIGQVMQTFSTKQKCEITSITHSSLENANLVTCILNGSEFFFTEAEAEFFLNSYQWIPAN